MLGDKDGASEGSALGEYVKPGKVGLTVEGELDGALVEGV